MYAEYYHLIVLSSNPAGENHLATPGLSLMCEKRFQYSPWMTALVYLGPVQSR